MLAKPCLGQASFCGSLVLVGYHAHSPGVVVFVDGRQDTEVELVSSMRQEEGETQQSAQGQVQVIWTLVC